MIATLKSLFNVFRKEKTPEQLLEELRIQEVNLKKEKISLELDSKQANRELNTAIKTAVEAERRGDAMGRKIAVGEMQTARSFSSQVAREQLINSKSLCLVKITSRKIAMMLRGKNASQQSLGALMGLLSSASVQHLITRYDIDLENFERQIEEMMGTTASAESRLPEAQLASEDEILITQLVKAQEKGDVAAAAEYMGRLTGGTLNNVS